MTCDPLIKSFETWHELPNVHGNTILYIQRLPGAKVRRQSAGSQWYKEKIYHCDPAAAENFLKLCEDADLNHLDDLLNSGLSFSEAILKCPRISGGAQR